MATTGTREDGMSEPRDMLLTIEERKALRLGAYGEDLAKAQLRKAADWFWELENSGDGVGWLMKDVAKVLTKAAEA